MKLPHVPSGIGVLTRWSNWLTSMVVGITTPKGGEIRISSIFYRYLVKIKQL